MSDQTPTSENEDDDFLAPLLDDFLRRCRAGERPSVEDYAAQHPDYAARIRDLFSAAVLIEQDASVHMTEQVGATIGRYKLLERIGEGGFGIVYMAEQLVPVRRKVALKVIKPGVDTRQVIARFEAERQALALMDHENIAKVLDAGSTESGRPYFVMELVRGVPITQFCDEKQLAMRDRLHLFVRVCRAVQHAHTKGIIHRDLKPTNVLVTMNDGRAVPKVIDFGVAKATSQQLTELTLFTNFAQMVGTPLYMSPEQAEMGVDVDTRSDIYSLGVLLYELLTGTTPLDKERLKQAAFDEVRRIIREEEPPRPSTRLSTAAALPSIAAMRHTEPARLTKLVCGELDWIVMKALEKERARRYETANGLAMDVERHLRDEPVLAGPPSAAYRLRKFLRRHRGKAIACFLLLLALVGGVIGTSLGLMRAERALRSEAERAEGERRAKLTAELRLAQVERGIELLGAIFDDLDPMAEENDGRPLRAIIGERLDSAVAKLDESIGDPLDIARLQDRLGRTYLGLGHADKAETTFAKVVAARQAILGNEHPQTLEAVNHQALAYHDLGKRREAIALFERVRDAQSKIMPRGDARFLINLTALAQEYWLSRQPEKAVVLLEEVRDERIRQIGADHEDTINVLQRLSGVYLALKRFPEAIALAEQVLEARERKLGPDHPRTIEAKHSLANVYSGAAKMRKALALLEEACEAATAQLGPEHPSTLVMQNNLAAMYRAFGRLPEAIALAEKVLESQVRIRGAGHPSTISTMYNLALGHRADGHLEKALPLLERAAVGVEKMGFSHTATNVIMDALCQCQEQTGQYGSAEIWRRKWVTSMKERYTAESVDYALALEGLGVNLNHQKKHSEAESVLRECVTIREKAPTDSPMYRAWTTARVRIELGISLLDQRKFQDAELALTQGYEGLSKSTEVSTHGLQGGPAEAQVNRALQRIIDLYEQWGKPEKAAHWRAELSGRQKK